MREKGDDLYIMQDESGMLKIGRSVDVDRRLKQLKTGNPGIRLMHVWRGKGDMEKRLHEDLSKFRVKLEWFEYMCLGSLPLSLYEEIPDPTVFDDWWCGGKK